MGYYLDAERTNLDELRKRIEETDLVPSRSSLSDNIEETFACLGNNGYVTLSDLRAALKNSKNIPSVSRQTGIGVGYLTLLRREIESYFPKAFPVSAFEWIPREDLVKLENRGYRNTVLLFEAFGSSKSRTALSADLGIDARVNGENKYFKGKIGLRDVRRLVKAASYVS